MVSDWISELEQAELPAPARRIYCNRTLNLRGLDAVGFDMDYTLVHYNVEAWERCAYGHLKSKLQALGLPVEHLVYDPSFAVLGLVIDIELGNVVKANRFGYVKRVAHGTRMLDFDEARKAYGTTQVDLGEKRWNFVNTLFALSEACMFAQLVDLFDGGKLPASIPTYTKIYEIVRFNLDLVHQEGALKADIVQNPARFVDLDPETPGALRDLRAAGKKVLLVTNSEWSYTNAMLTFIFKDYLGPEKTWRDFFDLVVVGARKPAFFTERMPAFEVLDDEGRLLPANGKLRLGTAYLGGHAKLIETSLGVSGEQIVYFGDHIFADVNVSKASSRWRTGLILRDLEGEIDAVLGFAEQQKQLNTLMERKELLEHRYSLMRMEALRREKAGDASAPASVRSRMKELRAELVRIDDDLAPLAKAAGELASERWGLLLRTGNDKSHLARQLEKHADVYTSRVSNLARMTPFVYLRSPRGSLPHDA